MLQWQDLCLHRPVVLQVLRETSAKVPLSPGVTRGYYHTTLDVHTALSFNRHVLSQSFPLSLALDRAPVCSLRGWERWWEGL